MKFDELDKKMRVFETSADLCVLPEHVYGCPSGRSWFHPADERGVPTSRFRLMSDSEI